MRLPLTLGWLLIPVLAGAYHYGPGQQRVDLDNAASLLRQAKADVAHEQWGAAVGRYDQALALIPSERVDEVRLVRLEKAKAQMMAKQLPVANGDLKVLLDEMLDDETADAEVLADVRSALANSQYYMTWLMRLEGLQREAWEPEIESARQTFKLLAEQYEAEGDATAATKAKEDLESSIRLARMDLSELQGLPLPSQ